MTTRRVPEMPCPVCGRTAADASPARHTAQRAAAPAEQTRPPRKASRRKAAAKAPKGEDTETPA